VDNVRAETPRRRSKVVDLILLVGAGIAVAGAGVAAFWVADDHDLTVWVFGALAVVGFAMVIARTYGLRRLQSPPFAIFSASWLSIHVFLFLMALGYLGLPYYLPLLVAELWIGFMIAIRLFGPPANRSR
jgi:hypothetical protein